MTPNVPPKIKVDQLSFYYGDWMFRIVDRMNGKMESAQRIVPHFQVIVSGVKINSVLERIGDFAVSIAEEVIFIASGRDVRYHA